MKKIIITGNAGRDPEMRADQDGNQFASFSVAISVGNKQTPKTDWVDVTCNGKLADVVRNYVKKGTKVLIEGFPTVNSYLNKENKPMASLRIYANTLELLSKREEDTPSNHPGDYNNGDPVYQHLPETGSNMKADDIPF